MFCFVEKILKRLKRIEKAVCVPHVRLVPRVGPFVEQSGPVTPTPQYRTRRKPNWRTLIMAFEMTATQETVASVTLLDRKGNPAQVDGVPTWGVDNTDVLALEPSADGMTCKIAAVGSLTADPVILTFRADADLGAGTEEVVGTEEITVKPGKASVVKLNLAPPTEQP